MYMKVHLSLNRRTSSKLSLCYWKISLFIKLIQGPDEGQRHIRQMTFYRESQEGISYGLGGRLICLLHISTLVFVGEEIQGGHRKGTSHITGLCVHQQRGPAGPSANIGSQSVDHLEAQASEVSCGQVSHSDTSSDLTLSSLCLHICRKGMEWQNIWALSSCGVWLAKSAFLLIPCLDLWSFPKSLWAISDAFTSELWLWVCHQCQLVGFVHTQALTEIIGHSAWVQWVREHSSSCLTLL